MTTDLYAILGVQPTATQVEITRAYRLLVRQHHPDTRTPDHTSLVSSGGVTDDSAARHDSALQEALDAYRVLNDPIQRAAYDKRRQPRARPVRRPQRPTPAPRVPDFDRPPIIAGPVYWERPGQR